METILNGNSQQLFVLIYDLTLLTSISFVSFLLTYFLFFTFYEKSINDWFYPLLARMILKRKDKQILSEIINKPEILQYKLLVDAADKYKLFSLLRCTTCFNFWQSSIISILLILLYDYFWIYGIIIVLLSSFFTRRFR